MGRNADAGTESFGALLRYYRGLSVWFNNAQSACHNGDWASHRAPMGYPHSVPTVPTDPPVFLRDEGDGVADGMQLLLGGQLRADRPVRPGSPWAGHRR